MREKFVHFLADNEAILEFETNLKESSGNSLAEYLNFPFHTEQSYFSGAFTWRISPQGHEYWRSLEEKWVASL